MTLSISETSDSWQTGCSTKHRRLTRTSEPRNAAAACTPCSWASAFNQDLSWCVDDGVSLEDAFENTCARRRAPEVRWACAPTPAPTTTPAPTATPAPTSAPLVADDSTIRTAVAAWLGRTRFVRVVRTATSRRGRLAGDMSELFYEDGATTYTEWGDCRPDAGVLQRPRSWDTRSMLRAWSTCSTAPGGDWAVHSVRDMSDARGEWPYFNGDIGGWKGSQCHGYVRDVRRRF